MQTAEAKVSSMFSIKYGHLYFCLLKPTEVRAQTSPKSYVFWEQQAKREHLH